MTDPDLIQKPGYYPQTSFEWLNKWGPRSAGAVIIIFVAAPFILATFPISVTFLIAIYLITRK